MKKPRFRFLRLLILILKKILTILLLPLYLFVFKVIKSKDNLSIKILKTLGLIFVVSPLSLILDAFIFVLIFGGFYYFGAVKSPIQVIGYSMSPTLTNNQYLLVHPFNNFMFWHKKIERGDIITFEDSKTDGKLYVKRVIGLPGDTLEIRNGFVYINGKILDESYISKYRSTYGGTFLSECQNIKVPGGDVFVLGDNRIRSQDSRFIGFVPEKDIVNILYFGEQGFLKSRWAQANGSGNINTTLLNVNNYVGLINKLRVQNNLKPLTLNPKLSKSAQLRAEMMLKFDDLTWTATKSGYPMSKSMADAGYYNTTYGEDPVLGYYTANDLYNYMTDVSLNKDFLLKKDYQDIGVAAVIGNLNNCPVQLVVQQEAGYVPPNYSANDIESWKTSLADLQKILPSWENIKNYSQTYNDNKLKADRLLEIINLRISRDQQIIVTMENNQWLSAEEQSWVAQDKALYDEQEGIAKFLNSFTWR